MQIFFINFLCPACVCVCVCRVLVALLLIVSPASPPPPPSLFFFVFFFFSACVSCFLTVSFLGGGQDFPKIWNKTGREGGRVYRLARGGGLSRVVTCEAQTRFCIWFRQQQQHPETATGTGTGPSSPAVLALITVAFLIQFNNDIRKEQQHKKKRQKTNLTQPKLTPSQTGTRCRKLQDKKIDREKKTRNTDSSSILKLGRVAPATAARQAIVVSGSCLILFFPTIIFGWYSILFRQFSFKWANPPKKNRPIAFVFNRKFMSPWTGYPFVPYRLFSVDFCIIFTGSLKFLVYRCVL